jgi:peptide-methionine (R)-S-oxide reductase
MMNRRFLLASAAAILALPHRGLAETFEVVLSEAEWRARLTKVQFQILREGGTERAGSSPLDMEYRNGTYHCAGCDQAVFSSATKYDSGTGWPSFYKPLANVVGTRIDRGLLGNRTEVHCGRCGGHFGHVFNDGPAPTGKRYCLNGAALIFRPA